MAVVILRRSVLAGKNEEQTSWFAPALTALSMPPLDKGR
jgi:hypothetical protein